VQAPARRAPARSNGGLAFIGPESKLALETAVAAGGKNRLWNVVDALYAAQGRENGGWVDDELLADVARRAGLDYQALSADRSHPWVAAEIAKAAGASRVAGVRGTPAFEIGPTGGPLQVLRLTSLGPEGIVPAIDAALSAA
jgi:protein-disulfide isomerase